MKNLFEHTSAPWIRYSSYEYKTGNDNNLYITVSKDAKPEMYHPMQEAEQLVMDAINERIRPLSYGISIPCSSWCRCAFPSCSRIKTVICVCANTVKKPLSQAGRGMSFAARSAKTSLMSTNQEKRKRGTKSKKEGQTYDRKSARKDPKGLSNHIVSYI